MHYALEEMDFATFFKCYVCESENILSFSLMQPTTSGRTSRRSKATTARTTSTPSSSTATPTRGSTSSPSGPSQTPAQTSGKSTSDLGLHFSHSGYERYDRARSRNTSNPVLHVRRRFETALNVVQLAGPWCTTMTAPLWSSSAPPPSVESPTCVTFA